MCCLAQSFSSETLDVLKRLALKVIAVSVDAKGNMLQGTPKVAINNFIAGIDAGGTVAILRPVYEKSVTNILPKVIEALQARGLVAVTMAQCFEESLNVAYA